ITSEQNASLPYASSLCGACYDVCPVKINIPEILVHLRDEDVRTQHGERSDDGAAAAPARTRRLLQAPSEMDLMMKGASFVMSSGKRMALAEKALPLGRAVAGRDRAISWLPGTAGGWTDERDIPAPPKESFRNWWAKHADETQQRVTADGGPVTDGAAATTGADGVPQDGTADDTQHDGGER
ncbi:(4Fe-4S)-binding protein, partial [Kocuria sp. CCUG 69068]|uniref:lactate utilisation protein LutB domain-containing protein n=1 Tax=Kocuria sp. CCUG 69068 TaxID=2043138 RepID=UPI001E5DC118|nr:(4Fe-4S)-binding protein [Kocuria sp. CCUG 69068]